MATKKSQQSGSSSSSKNTMDELLAQYGGGVKGLSSGDKVKGRVVGQIKAHEILKKIVDSTTLSEGIIAEKAYKEAENYIRDLNVGDEVEAQVIVPETTDGYSILSLRHASADSSWDKISKAEEDNKILSVEVRNAISSGLIVDIKGLNGFIPNSQLGHDVVNDKNSLVGKKIKAIIIDVNRNENKIVLSEKEVSEAGDLELMRNAQKKVKEDELYDGVVSTIYDFGIFVKIEVKADTGGEKVPVEGLVHISEMSWDKINKPEDIVKVGQKVKVKVIGKKEGKLAFSMKQIQDDPWKTIGKKYPKETKVKGKAVKVSDFGIFVVLEPGVEGLLHITKIPPGTDIKVGDSVNVFVEDIDEKERKISLGLILTAKPIGYK
ncbi:MAG: RNA binding S1 domain protein [Candidatus Woesebacteria bacterium GW2011_GWA1_39_8]|uniref:RNA binding S1 domain protein n=1 Tax=Candidatus Woesebacteria bacterium GW2011_GWA1_39_8 TaxID=1618552 RepID=A0A0G0PKJ6_9BACT|nr:MAG: RNA binding S1 domain protein [Candidatus Woesebacteria bacterium GW2011_GWA1_39_8]